MTLGARSLSDTTATLGLARGDLETNDSPEMRRSILQTAIARGHWSIWMQVFQDDVAMRAQLNQWFQGTARDCFDAETRPIGRAGGLI
jgi:hypothetical protein